MSTTNPIYSTEDEVGMDRLLRGEVPTYSTDLRIHAADGTLRWVARSASMLRSADGSPSQYVIQIKDIGERKTAERALLDKTRRLRDAEAVGHSGSWELHIATEKVSWSDGLYDVFGVDRNEFGGDYDAAAKIIHPDDRAMVRDATDACVLRGVPLRIRYRLIRPNDGAVRWVEARAEQLYEDGRLTHIGGAVVDITELHEVDDRLRQVIEHAPMGLAIIDQDQRYLDVNPAFRVITGYSEEQLLGMRAGDIVVPVDPAGDRAGIQRVLDGDIPSYTSDTRFRAADGTLRWAAMSASLLTTASGPHQLIVQIKDIGDRKRTEQALLEKTRRLREAETVGRLGSWELDLSTKLLSYSDGLLALYGLDPADFSGDRDAASEMVHPPDRAPLRAASDACMQEGTPFQLRYRLTRPDDGRQRWFEVRAQRFEVDGKPHRVGGTVVEVTELVAAEAEIRTAYTFQQTVMDASPDLILAYQVATRSVVWSNRSLSGVLGFGTRQSASAHQQTTDTFVPPGSELSTALISAMDTVGDNTTQLNLRLMDAAGEYRWFSLRATPLHRDDRGEVSEVLGILRDVTEAMIAQKDLEHTALHDSLTGLPNRALLIDRIDGALARSERDHREISVLFCDLDGFKHVNDTAGHAAGDAVLIETARRLQQVLRDGDTVARVGGDEFIVLIEPWNRRPKTDHPTDPDQVAAEDRALAPRIAARIAHAIREPIVINGVDHVVTASIGITYGSMSHAGDVRTASADDMLQDADAAMYKAKSRGKDRFEIFELDMRANLQERGRVERILRQALGGSIAPAQENHGSDRIELEPRLTAAYQPVFDSTSGRLVGFEALARLVDADGVNVPPDVFIGIAEEIGVIHQLGLRILDLACGQLARWRHHTAEAAGITMAVNLSAIQAADGSLGGDVHKALATHWLQPNDLILELTETALLQAAHSTIVNLRVLHDDGVGIAIDDFGIGYASLRYLATLPVSALKIDRSFTAGLPHDDVSRKIVMAVAGLAADLDMTCIVEGVETQEQLDALPPAVQLQGYLTGRPQPPEAIDLRNLITQGAAPAPRDSSRRSPA